MHYIFVGLWLICFVPLTTFAQEYIDPEILLEGIESEDLGETDFLAVLQDLEDDPININTASFRDLLRIPFLDDQSAQQIVNYRDEAGTFSHLDSLRQVPNLPPELVETISPFVQLQSKKKPASIDYRAQFGRPLHKIEGYFSENESRRYENPLYLYHRLRLRPQKHLQLGALWEKDVGEANWYDFGSFYANYYWEKGNSYFHIGDFNLESGQRLLFSGPYGSPLLVGSNAPFRQSSFRWRDKAASDENAFFRGAFWQYEISQSAALLLAYSNHDWDATLHEDTLAIRSFYTAGYHRTETEEAKRNQAKEQMWSGIFTKSMAHTRLGLQIALLNYSLPVETRDGVFQQDFRYLSAFYNHQQKQVIFQGEAALLNGKFPALQQSILFRSPSPRLSYGALFYYHHPDYWTLHGRTFGQTSDLPGNETGYFLTMDIRVLLKTEVAAYFHAARPVSGFGEFAFVKQSSQFQLSQKIKKSRLLIRLSQRKREHSPNVPASVYAFASQKTQSLRFHLVSDISRHWRLAHRLEISRAKPAEALHRHHGFLLYQDVRYHLSANSVLQARWSQFDVPDFDYRIYEFENDLPGSFRNVLLNGRGFKWFALFKYHLAKKWHIALKYKEIYYPDEETLGSGLDTVLGNRKKELRFQFRVIY